jgi:hypothetical protein
VTGSVEPTIMAVSTHRKRDSGASPGRPSTGHTWRQLPIRSACLLVLVLASTFLTSAQAQATGAPSPTIIYVSPFGSDANPGTQDAPLRTLDRAQQVVRTLNHNMSADITVYLENGTYRLTQPLRFGPLDSGTNGHDVVWAGAPGATAVISGADRISGWKLINASKNIWAAPVPATLRTRQIYVNGARASMTIGRVPVRVRAAWNGYTASSSVMSHWRNPNQMEFVYDRQLGQMAEAICPIDGITGTDIAMGEPCWNNTSRRWRSGELVDFGKVGTTPTYVENVYELLTHPGEFYLDNSAHRLYYIPRAGEVMATADVEAPAIQTLIEGAGTPGAPLHNLTFSNLQFSYATWMQPSSSTGFSEVQAGYTVTGKTGYATEGLCNLVRHGTCPFGTWTKEPGSVQFRYDQYLTFDNDRFLHLGAAGLNLDNGTQYSTVEGSVFTDISGNGIELGGVDKPKAGGSTQTTNDVIANNHLYGLPVEYHGGVAILAGYVSNTSISHNQIDHVAYAGISIGWGGWPDKIGKPVVSNNSHGDVIADNLIYDFMLTLDDGGGIYTLGITGTSIANGEKVTGNVVHDQLGWSFALHSDDGASYITYSRNVLYNNNYDWGTSHLNYNSVHGGLDPLLLEHNYWQQGNLNSLSYRGTMKDNKIITGPAEVPPAIISNAGIQPAFQSNLSWQTSGESVPNPPTRVEVMYAFRGVAYVTWRPSYGDVNGPVTSYTITACRVRSKIQSGCTQPAVPPAMISAATYDQLGYARVSGLTDGTAYQFMVTAQSAGGSSSPSIPTGTFKPTTYAPRLPGRPKDFNAQSGYQCVRLLWYPANGPRVRPPLAYLVTSSTGQTYTLTSLGQLAMSDRAARILHVVGGLISGHRYRFSVAAVTPAGTGPAVQSHWVKAG